MDSRPVGVFDSGVGGLTVLHECLVTMPHEDFVYLGDHARLPYGPRPLEEPGETADEQREHDQGDEVLGAHDDAADRPPLRERGRERVVAGDVRQRELQEQQQLRGVLSCLGATPSTPVTILSDGAEGPRSLGEAACIGPTSHVLDWFRAT